MSPHAAEILVLCLGLYALVGAVFGLFFVLFGARRMDPDAVGMALQVRMLIFWGAAALWPLMAFKTLIGARRS